MVPIVTDIINYGKTYFRNKTVSVPSPAGCTASGDSCSAVNGMPGYEYATAANPAENYDYNDPNRPPVTWDIVGLHNCISETSIDGITITSNFGTVETKAVEGKLNATVSYNFSERPDHITVTITGKNGRLRK